MYKRKFYPITYERAIMYPMLEMASRVHIKFIPEVLYIYRDNTSFNDFAINRCAQLQTKNYIIKQSPYKPL